VSQVNLLPPELRQRQAVRRATSIVVLVGLALLALIGVFYFLQVQQLSGAQDDLEAQQARNGELEGQIAGLQEFADLQAELVAKQQLLTTIFVNEVSWSSALLDVSRVIPDAQYLTNLTGQLTSVIPAEGVPTTTGGTPATTLIGAMTFAGVASETETIATWLTRLEQVQGWVNAWVNSATQDAPFSRIYTFQNGLDLTQEAATERGLGGTSP
jgi:Tfp pilus assembly protein PilN